MGDVVLKIEEIDEIILDSTDNGDPYKVVFKRIDDMNFEQTVIGENVCECCGESIKDCTCNKEKMMVAENMLLNYVNDLFNSDDDVLLTIDGTKYRKK